VENDVFYSMYQSHVLSSHNDCRLWKYIVFRNFFSWYQYLPLTDCKKLCKICFGQVQEGGGGNWTLENFRKWFCLIWRMNNFIENYSRWYVRQTTKVQKQLQYNISQPDTINWNQKTVFENTVYSKNSSWKLIQEIKELYQIQVCNELLIKELFINQYKLCLVYENYL